MIMFYILLFNQKGAAERKRGCIQHRNEQAKIMLGERFNDEVVKKVSFYVHITKLESHDLDSGLKH